MGRVSVTAAVSALPGLAGGAVAASPVLAGGRGGGWQVTRVRRVIGAMAAVMRETRTP
jgi:hypothetical protein